ncbi:MAG: isoprenylcysteine carboxylmethyltransferase family protein [Candidatus Methanoperedens sp.]
MKRKKFFGNLISLGFIALMALALFKGISVLLGYEDPANIEGSGHHAFTDYAYSNWGATLFSVGIFSVFVLNLSFGHAQGHLLGVLISSAGLMSMEAAWALVMVTSSVVIFLGLFLMSKGWSMIHASSGELVTGGIYRYVRHPQYLGLIVLTVGLLIQWPTIITLLMWPVLVTMYYRLAKREEKEAMEAFGERYEEYRRQVPMFLPFMRRRNTGSQVML